MKVRMKSHAAGPDRKLEIGEVYDLPDEQAMELFEGGYADIVPTSKAIVDTSQVASPPIEFATNNARETAESPRGRKRK